MKCNKCGNNIREGATFCPFCGTMVEKPAARPVTYPAPSANAYPQTGGADNAVNYQAQDRFGAVGGVPQSEGGSPKNIGKTVIAAAAAVVVIAAAVGFSGFVKNTKCSQPFKKFEEGFEDCDIELMLEAFPEGISSLITDEVGSDEMDEAETEMQDALEELADEMDYGSEFAVSHEIMRREKLSKDSVDRLNELFEMGDLDIEVKKAYSVDVRFTVEGDNGNEGYITGNFSVGKTDDGWKIVDFNNILSDYSQYEPIDEAAEAIFGMLSGQSDDIFNAYDDDYGYDDDYDYDY